METNYKKMNKRDSRFNTVINHELIKKLQKKHQDFL